MLKNYHNLEFVRFLIVGGFNTLFGYGCYWLLLTIGVDYRLALLMAQIVGVLFNFRTTGRLVFKSTDNRLILRFILVYVVTYGLNVALVRVLFLAGVDKKIGGALTILPLAIISYLLNRRFVFRAPATPQPE